MLPIGWLARRISATRSGLGAHLPTLIIGGVVYIVLMSFFVSAVCGYMAGLIGSSNSPLSGIGILVVIGAALLLVIGVKPYVGPDAGKALMAFALFTTAVIFNVAAIANNNLQDLKTGQLVDATPWKQQVALVFRCHRRRIGHSAGARSHESRLRFRRRAGRRTASAPFACASSWFDFIIGERRDRRRHRLEFDPESAH